jgi:hypothetical protein
MQWWGEGRATRLDRCWSQQLRPGLSLAAQRPRPPLPCATPRRPSPRRRPHLTLASDSPNHMVSSSGPLTLMKLAWHSLAMALASSVLPQPGGP